MDYSWNHTGTRFWAWEDILKNQEASAYKDWFAITQFDNSFSDMNITNKKGFNLMDQLKPKLIIPTAHVSQAAIAYAVETWTGYVHTDPGSLIISRTDLPEERSILIFGPLAFAYQSLFNLPSW